MPRIAPALSLVLYSKLDDAAVKTCMAACHKMAGVDAKMCKCSEAKGEIDVRLNGDKKVTAEEIIKTMKTTGVEAHLSKMQPAEAKRAAAVTPKATR